ncbi:MAG TPA: AEC family transporter [Solirubrobacterales bacterium]|nr:AEC family transporter [Solirubrobacterales bacterium]
MGVLITAAVIFLSVGVGIWAEHRRPEAAGAAARRSLHFVLYVPIPLVVFFNLAHADLDVEHGVGILLGLVSIAASAVLAWIVCNRFLHLSRPQTGAVLVTTLSLNSAYLGYPLTAALLGRDELPTAVLFDVLVCAPSLLLGAFAVGAAFGEEAGESPRERIVAFFARNPPLYAAVAGLLAPEALAPDVLVDFSQALIVAILPLGFFAVGATLAENAEHGVLPMPPKLTRPVVLALVSRLLIAPGLLILLASPLVDLPAPYLLIAAMPAGVNSLIVANAYGLDMEIVAETIAWSTALVIAAALVSLLL